MYVTPERILKARIKTKAFNKKTLRQSVQNQCLAGDDQQAFGWLKKQGYVKVTHYPAFEITMTEAGEKFLNDE